MFSGDFLAPGSPIPFVYLHIFAFPLTRRVATDHRIDPRRGSVARSVLVKVNDCRRITRNNEINQKEDAKRNRATKANAPSRGDFSKLRSISRASRF